MRYRCANDTRGYCRTRPTYKEGSVHILGPNHPDGGYEIGECIHNPQTCGQFLTFQESLELWSPYAFTSKRK